MFCIKCGAALPEGAAFCVACGAKVAVPENSAPAPVKKEKKPVNKKLIGIISAAAAVLIIVLVVILTRKPKIELNPYLEVSFEGYEGYGRAVYDFDEDAFEEEYGELLSKKMADDSDALTSWVSSLISGYYGEMFLEVCADGYFDKETELSNGDVISFIWECNDEQAQAYGVRLSYEDVQYTVEGLQGMTQMDPFKDVTVTFSGYDTYGEAILNVSKNPYFLEYDVEPDENLKNGDSIIVSVRTSPWNGTFEEQHRKNYGVEFTQLSKSYTVEGLTEIVEIDPFEDIELVFSNVNGEGTVDIINNSTNPAVAELRFSADPNRRLSNQDVITISAETYQMNPEAYFTQKYGVRFTSMEKEYTVEGLGNYAAQLSELTTEILNELSVVVSESLYATAEGSWDEGQTLSQVNYLGCYFTAQKDMTQQYYYGLGKNRVYMIYELHGSDNYENGSQGEYTYYYVAYCDDIVKNADETCTTVSIVRAPANGFTREVNTGDRTMSLYYNGFETLEGAQEYCMLQNYDSYNYENSFESLGELTEEGEGSESVTE